MSGHKEVRRKRTKLACSSGYADVKGNIQSWLVPLQDSEDVTGKVQIWLVPIKGYKDVGRKSTKLACFCTL